MRAAATASLTNCSSGRSLADGPPSPSQDAHQQARPVAREGPRSRLCDGRGARFRVALARGRPHPALRAGQRQGPSFLPVSLHDSRAQILIRDGHRAQGTFSQRHAILADQGSERVAVPLQSLGSRPLPSASASSSGKVGTFEVVNSPLSEYAVVGFEQGVAWVSPRLLPIWEAQVRALSLCHRSPPCAPWLSTDSLYILSTQFGDFHNTAQVRAHDLLFLRPHEPLL